MSGDRYQRFYLIIIFIFAITISLLDLTGILSNIPFLSNRIPTITLLILGVIVGFLILEKYHTIDRMHQDMIDGYKKIEKTYRGATIKRFNNLVQLNYYVIEKMYGSNKVDELSWAWPETQEKRPDEQKAYTTFKEAKKEFCKRENACYREVFIFPGTTRIKRLKQAAEDYDLGYRARYYNDLNFLSMKDKDKFIPRLSFMVFDSEEVVTLFYAGPYGSVENEIRISISNNKDIVQLFQDYFDSIFHGAIPLIDTDEVNWDEIKKIEKTLENK